MCSIKASLTVHVYSSAACAALHKQECITASQHPMYSSSSSTAAAYMYIHVQQIRHSSGTAAQDIPGTAALQTVAW